MDIVPIRRCPECGEEFQPHIVSCSECGAQLEDGIEGQAPPARSTSADADETAYVPITGIIDAQDVLDAGKELNATQLRYRLVPTARRGGLGLEVHEQDAGAAIALLTEAGLLPPSDDSPPVSEAGGPCPACGAQVAARTVECGECGLVLGSSDPES